MDEIDKSLIQQAIAIALVSCVEEAVDSIRRSVLGRRIIALWVLRCAEDACDNSRTPYAQTVLSEARRMLDTSSALNSRVRVAEALMCLNKKTYYTSAYTYVFNCAEASVNTRVSDAEKAAYVCYSAGSALQALRHDMQREKGIPIEETEEKQRGYLLEILNQRLNP